MPIFSNKICINLCSKHFLLAGISLVVIVVVLFWLSRVLRSDWMMALPLSLIVGGACGNLIDRIRFSYVIDFLDFHFKNWHFATFNLADSAITIGAFLLIIKLFFSDRRHPMA